MQLTERNMGQVIRCTMTGVEAVVITRIDGDIWYKMLSNGTVCKYTDREENRWEVVK